MDTDEIYQRFGVPPNLREHLKRVVAVVGTIADHWQGPKINKELLEKAALVHDLGNIVKFDLQNHPELLGEEERNLDYWIKTRQEIIQKYGSDDHEVTRKMLEEMGTEQEVIDLILAKSFSRALEIEKSGFWELKILFYADMRVGPFGLMSLEERLSEVLSRSKDKYPNAEGLVAACKRIEEQIGEMLDISVKEL